MIHHRDKESFLFPFLILAHPGPLVMSCINSALDPSSRYCCILLTCVSPLAVSIALFNVANFVKKLAIASSRREQVVAIKLPLSSNHLDFFDAISDIVEISLTYSLVHMVVSYTYNWKNISAKDLRRCIPVKELIFELL